MFIFDSTVGGVTKKSSFGCAYGHDGGIGAPWEEGSGELPCPVITRARVQHDFNLSWRIVFDLAVPPPPGANLYHAHYKANVGGYEEFVAAYSRSSPTQFTRHTSGTAGWPRTLGLRFRAADGRVSVGCSQGVQIVMPDSEQSFEVPVITVPATPAD